MHTPDPFGATRELDVGGTTYRMADLTALEEAGLCELDSLPVSIRVLLEGSSGTSTARRSPRRTWSASPPGRPTSRTWSSPSSPPGPSSRT